MPSANSDTFMSSFPVWISFVSFCCMIVMARTSQLCWQSEHPFFVLDLRRKSFQLFTIDYGVSWAFSGGSDGKKSACNVGDQSLIPGSGRSPGEGGYFCPLQYSYLKNSPGQRSLVSYSPWDCKEPDMTERGTLSLHDISCGFVKYGLYYVEVCFLCVLFLESCHNKCWFLSSVLHLLRWSYGFYSSICWYGVSHWFVDIKKLLSLGWIPFFMVYDSFMYCLIWFVSILLRIFSFMFTSEIAL